jgi:hypothetical protein
MSRIGRLTLAACAAALLWPAAATAASTACTKATEMTLSGKVRQIQSLREEPQAEIETWFWLDIPAPICGKTSISASVIGPIPCSEGDAIALSGEFSPPSPMTDTARIRAQRGTVSCTAPH